MNLVPGCPVHSGTVLLGVWAILLPYGVREKNISASFFFSFKVSELEISDT